MCIFLRAQLRSGGLPRRLSWKRICLQCVRHGFDPWVGKVPWRRERPPIPVFWPGEFHGLYSPWGRKESDTTAQLSLSLFNAFEESGNEKTKERLSTEQVVLLWEQFCFPRGYLAMSRDLCGCHSWEGGMLVASSR